MDSREIEQLRKELEDHYGTAMQFFPQAVMDLSEVEQASPEELIRMAKELGYDIPDDEEEEKGFGLNG